MGTKVAIYAVKARGGTPLQFCTVSEIRTEALMGPDAMYYFSAECPEECKVGWYYDTKNNIFLDPETYQKITEEKRRKLEEETRKQNEEEARKQEEKRKAEHDEQLYLAEQHYKEVENTDDWIFKDPIEKFDYMQEKFHYLDDYEIASIIKD